MNNDRVWNIPEWSQYIEEKQVSNLNTSSDVRAIFDGESYDDHTNRARIVQRAIEREEFTYFCLKSIKSDRERRRLLGINEKNERRRLLKIRRKKDKNAGRK